VKKMVVMILMLMVLFGIVMADEYEGCEEYYAICNPASHVNVREFPNRKSDVCCTLYCGDVVLHDGKMKNGFMHLVGLSNESGEGWVSPRYVDYWGIIEGAEGMYRVVGSGRVAIRSGIDGNVVGWLKPGKVVEVLAISDDWAVMKNGFVRAEYLEEADAEK